MRREKKAERLYIYMFEGLAAFLVMALFSASENLISSAFGVLSAWIAGGAAAAAVCARKTKGMSLLSYAASGIPPALLLLLTGFGPAAAVIGSALSIWRFYVRFIDGDDEGEGAVMILSLLVGAGTVLTGHGEGVIIPFVLLLQIMMYSLKSTVLQLVLNRQQPLKKKAGHVLLIAGVPAALTGLYLLISSWFPLIQLGFLSGFSKAVSIITTAIAPLIPWMGQLEHSREGQDDLLNPPSPPVTGQDYAWEGQQPGQKIVTAALVAGAVVMLVLIIFLLKKKLAIPRTLGKKTGPGVKMGIRDGAENVTGKEFLHRFRHRRPQGIVRRKFFELEQTAARFGKGRRMDETAEEWFRRIEMAEDSSALHLYYRVRYGGMIITDAEIRSYLAEINRLKGKLKEGS